MPEGRILFALVITGAVVSLCGVAAAETQSEDDVPTQVWDFGYVPQKSEVNHVFYLRNTGASPLSVDKVKAGCSCTSVSEIDRPIPPGDSAAIAVTFKSGRYLDGVKKTTKIYTKGKEEPAYHLRIVAFVIKQDHTAGDLRLTPPRFKWKTKDAVIGIGADTLAIAHAGGDSLRVSVVNAHAGIVDRLEFPQGPILRDQMKLVVHASKEPVPDGIDGPSITLAFAGQDTTIVTVPIELKD